jgi:hypothetical protein
MSVIAGFGLVESLNRPKAFEFKTSRFATAATVMTSAT